MNYLQQELFRLIKEEDDIFSFIQEAALDGLWYWDLESPEDEWMDPKFWTTLGYDPVEMPHKVSSWQNLIHPDDLEEAKKSIGEHLSNPNIPYDQIVRYTGKSGSTVWVRCRGMALRDADGRPIRMLGAHQNVTELMENNLALKATSERIRKLSQAVEQSLASVMITDLNGQLEYVNNAFCETTGYTQEEVLGRNPRFMKSGKQSPQFYKNLWDSILAGKVWRGEFHNRKKNGELFWESASISPVKNDAGQITHYVAVKEDITEKVQHMEDTRLLLTEKEEQNSRLTSFTHIVSHNLRSHSANMIGIITLLEMENPELLSNPYVQLLQASSQKLQETITDLNSVLDMSINGNAARVDIDLRKHVQSTWSSISLLAQDARVELHNDVQEGYTLRVIPSYLQSIILNLLTNAIKYRSHERNSEVRIAAWRDHGHHVITVTDNGIGIDLPRHQKTLFGMYKTFHDHQDSKGLGLFMVKNQVEAMGGEIQVASEVGEGTTFTILLPVTEMVLTPR